MGRMSYNGVAIFTLCCIVAKYFISVTGKIASIQLHVILLSDKLFLTNAFNDRLDIH